ncbi:hypothetical protein [Sodalis ligni]|uniref:Uncharacterized protein n=1 Tax=Sodalis ligni TaxID=2697027 RepID=A0A4R1NHU4_9GAMM|nr:hypothetical protein [Sodalis ligni]TCL06637.1 hypothetical protein EZJ58_4906 [Sodalis ligni]
MDGVLIFCKDSILRFRSDYDDLTAVPLLSIQDCLEEENALFLLQYFRHRVIIEEGTTLSDMFLAIEPWAGVLAAYLDIDVRAYIDEIRKPSQVEAIFDWIGIQKVTSVHRAYQHPDIHDGEDLTSYFNRERIPTKHFDIEAACTANGYKNGDKEHYSISGDIHTIKNVPVVISDRQILVSYGQDKNNLLNHRHAGVVVNNKTTYIQGGIAFSLNEVMEALFNDGLFYFSPQIASHDMAKIKEMAEIIEKNEDESREAALYSGIDEEEKLEAVNKIKVEIAEGAFDPMIDHMESEQAYWQYVKSLCDSNSELPIRIGQIDEAKSPEHRFYNFIMDDN